jgi:formate dehydrogenase subunit delta
MSHESSIRAGRDKLIYMANQIATFFEAQPKEEAVEGVAKHINDFWEPRMRRQFFEIVDAGGEGLKPQVIAAAKSIRRPAPEPAPAGHA